MEGTYRMKPGQKDPVRSIYRVWQRWTRRIPARISWWGEADAVTSTYRLAALLALAWLPMDEALWSIRWFPPAEALAPHPPRAAVAVLCGLALWLINAVLLHGYLEKAMPSPLPCRPWVKALRLGVSGVPLLGLAVLPLWRWLVDRQPGWAFRPPGHRVVPLAPGRLPLPVLGSQARWIESVGPMIWLLAVNFLAVGAAATWWAAPLGRDLLVPSIIVHLLLAGAVAFCLRQYLLQPAIPVSRRVLAPLILLLVLTPLPYLVFLGFLLLDRVRPETGPATTLVHEALFKRSQAARLPLWLRLVDAVQPKTRRDLPVEPPGLRLEHGLLRLYDLKTLVLGLDAGVLGWGLLRLTARWPEVAARIDEIIERIAWILLWLGGLAALVAAVHYLWAVLRLPGPLRFLDRHPYASYLARSQIAFAIGIDTGRCLATGTRPPGYLKVVLFLSLIILGFRIIAAGLAGRTPLGWRRFADFALMPLPVVALGAIRAYVVRQESPTAALDRSALIWMVFSLLLGVALARTLLPWLTRPDPPEGLVARGTPARLRLRLAALVLPTVLPLGGVAVPLWIHLRRSSR